MSTPKPTDTTKVKMSNGRDPWDEVGSLDEHLRKLQEQFRRILGGGGRSNRKGSGGFNFGLPPGVSPSKAFGLVGAILLTLYFLGGIFVLDEQERAVVLRLGTFKEVAGPGLNWRFLVVDRIYVENISRVRQHNHDSEMLTKDENIVRVPVTIQYDIKDIESFILKVRNPEASLKFVTESSLRHIVGNSTMDGVLSAKRAEIAVELRDRLQHFMDLYGTGLRVIQVNLLKGNPPSEVQEAFIDVVKAAEDKERLRNEAEAYANKIVPEARGEAARILNQAQAYKESVIAGAIGESERFTNIRKEYEKAPVVTRRRLYLDALDEVMSSATKVVVSDDTDDFYFLPLEALVQEDISIDEETDEQVKRFNDVIQGTLNTVEQARRTRRRGE